MKNAINNIKQYATNKKVAIGLSGGVDSMCLLSLLLSCKDSLQGIVAVHCNHHLREQADSDCLFVKDYCKKVGVEVVGFECDIAADAKQNGNSIELQARLWRRQIYQGLMQTGFDMVALGHHINDQIETVLFRIFRGTGIKGLCAMPILSQDMIFRPMLQNTKQELLEYCKINNIPFVQDQSNFDNNYDRNFIRQDILPLIQKRWDVQNIAKLSIIATRTQAYIDSQIEQNLVAKENDSVVFGISLLDNELFFEYANIALKKLGLSGDVVDAKSIERLCSLKDLGSGKSVNINNNIVAYREFDKVRILLPSDSVVDMGVQCQYNGIGEYSVDKQTIKVQLLDDSNNVFDKKNRLVFDLDAIPKDAVFRHRLQGDWFRPFGGHKKSLKKYLIQKKIPTTQRDSTILLAVDSEVLCVLGVEIADRIKAKDTTTRGTFIFNRS